MSDLDRKANEYFPGVVVRKDLVKKVRGNAIVPSYVLEYLLGQYAASDNESTIQAGIDSVRKILADHYVHRNEAELVKSTIRERGRHKVIDRVSVTLNEKADTYEASFENLGLRGVIVDPVTVKNNEKLLVSGVWCICDIEYFHTDDSRTVPWILGSLKAIQLPRFDLEGYVSARSNFTSDEWVDLFMQSIGFNPEQFTRRAKLFQLTRLIPYVERNYNLVELGPKGTGKSHVYSEFSPHGMLISGGEVTVAKLFVNNASKQIGLVGFWDVVAFDEFAGKKKKTDKALVDIMKNYMANKTFSRGVQTMSAEASMVFVGNTAHNVPYMLKHSDLFDELPEAYHDSAFLDRIHFYLPGWEIDPIRSEMFSDGYGFIVDYAAEALRSLRTQDYSDKYQSYFTLGDEISTRDRDGIQKTFSGLMKLLYPSGEATQDEIEEILVFAIEGRKRVKDQIPRIDETMSAVPFGYADPNGDWHDISTLEEQQYPNLYAQTKDEPTDLQAALRDSANTAASDVPLQQQSTSPTNGDTPRCGVGEKPAPRELKTGIVDYHENQTGVTYKELFMDHLRGCEDLIVVDPYIRLPHQCRNFADFLGMLAAGKDDADEIRVTLRTASDKAPEHQIAQAEHLEEIKRSAAAFGIDLFVTFDDTIHDRWIETDNGWRILLGRGLDIFQKPADQYEIGLSHQEFRKVYGFSITYLKQD
ncbi:BREX system Lon protease-like protein BrxL [Corynebacterium phoceense]|uniref:BREX system Lon protease-like protein BrxL n=1 Tax=Corynebacterium phoceense TaxID=1686286 RepID=UPI001DD872D5|nr:BREX system Lon protease-like protein BrxL [Corynebacterium phoceense]HJG42482.1 BREX system Lon protease-like protein BrxL [Corynebacterium phoceense]